MPQKILILDFGSQYTQLIARRVREINVYCEIYPYNNFPNLDESVRGIILSGSPASVRDAQAPKFNVAQFDSTLPILGICFGAQLIAQHFQGTVEPSLNREYGRAVLNIVDRDNDLFQDLLRSSDVWMSHADTISMLPSNFKLLASTDSVTNAAFQIEGSSTFGIQFHPEVTHTKMGTKIIENFVRKICGCAPDWSSTSFINSSIVAIQKTVKDEAVVMGLSGGVDSTVAAYLLHQSIGSQLHCIFIDNGLLRKNEFEQVLDEYKNSGLNIKGVRAKELFLSRLKDISDPEQKRKIIGKTFIDVFEKEAKSIKNVKWLAQGTIYPDRIESVSVLGPSAKIKSHHNVGGLPEKMNLKVIEPISSLFKDEVRRVGLALEIPKNNLFRHPFPGPGLGVRILGAVDETKVSILQEVDDIFISLLKKHDLYHQIWQAGAIFLPIQSVGVMGDERTYEYVVSLRAVVSEDGMTADWFRFPNEFLAMVSNEIINKVKGVNRVVYDISSKPPATIEWE